MKLRQISGAFLLSLPFIGLIAFTVYKAGWEPILIPLAITGLMFMCIWFGVKLLFF